jgi:hypothetical protein
MSSLCSCDVLLTQGGDDAAFSGAAPSAGTAHLLSFILADEET